MPTGIKPILIAIAFVAAGCGGSQSSHDVTTTDPSGVVPTMNETSGAAPVTAAAPAQQTGTFDRYDNSGFAGLKTGTMSPVAAATRSGAPTTTPTTTAPAATTTTPQPPAGGSTPTTATSTQ